MSWLTWIRKLTRRSSSAARRSRRPARRHTARPQLERLEDRWLLSVGDIMQTFVNPTPFADDKVSYSVAGAGNRMVVGAPGDDFPSQDSGVAYLIDATTGQSRTLVNPFPARGDQFGYSVAADGNNVVVGMLFDEAGGFTDSGSVYLFNGTTGTLAGTFFNPTPANDDRFGSSVAAFGNRVVVGASGDRSGGFAGSGAAYLFDVTTGALLRTFLNPTPAASDNFGYSVAVSEDHVTVGAPGDRNGRKGGFANSGAVYLFNAMSGALLRTILNPTPATLDLFGYSVATVESNVLVGAPFDDPAGRNADTGRAYQFDSTTGALLHTFDNPVPNGAMLARILNPAGPFLNTAYGFSVAAARNNIVVGNTGPSVNAFVGSGAAYLIDGTTFDSPTGNGPDDLTLRRNGVDIELIDNNTGSVLDTQPVSDTHGIIIAGADGEDDTLTIDYFGGGSFPQPIHFSGGSDAADRLRFIGDRSGVIAYAPDSRITGAGALNPFVSPAGGPIGFEGVETTEVSNVSTLLVPTPNDGSELTVDADFGANGQPANVLAGTTAGVAITPVTFFDSANFQLNTGGIGQNFRAPSRITIGDAGLIAQGLKTVSIATGYGMDELAINSASFALPVPGGYFEFHGGPGYDQITVLSDADVTLTNGTNGELTSSAGGRIFVKGVEQAFLVGASGNNRLDASGFAGPVTLAGGDGDDTLLGGSNSDVIVGGDGDDVMSGGTGNNTVDGGTGADSITAGTGRDRITGGDGDDTVAAGSGDDFIDGGDGNNRLDGGDGNDRITALEGGTPAGAAIPASGNNTLLGGAGNDTLTGGSGRDSLDGGTGNDSVAGGRGADTLARSTGNDTLDGGDGNDRLDGGTGNNVLLGGIGNDILLGGTGCDFLDGGTGCDFLDGGTGCDFLDGGTGDDSLDGGASNDTLRGGDGADTLSGGAGADDLDSGPGPDSLSGGAGADLLMGGDDDDTLSGGADLDGGLGTDTCIDGESIFNCEL